MPDKQEYRPLIDWAEKAAAAGNYASAEELLREGARLQEAELGPLDPALANTLNNLGVVCEIVDKQDDAEVFYRRAHEIAQAVLPNDHPFVATSRQNLNDFYRVRGRTPSAPPAPATAIDPKPEIDPVPLPRPERSVAPPQTKPSPIDSPRLPVPVRRSPRLFAVGALILFGLVVLLTVNCPRLRSSEPGEASPIGATLSVPENPAPAPRPVEPAAPLPAPEKVAANPRPAPREGNRPGIPARPGLPVVASAELCRVLSTGGSGDNWQCTPPSRPADAGWLSFYTRVRSAKDTTVEHRWYLGDHLYQVVELRVQANQGSGYRTYSRYNMKAESAGNWKVEVRSDDGILLYEERFVVR